MAGKFLISLVGSVGFCRVVTIFLYVSLRDAAFFLKDQPVKPSVFIAPSFRISLVGD